MFLEIDCKNTTMIPLPNAEFYTEKLQILRQSIQHQASKFSIINFDFNFNFQLKNLKNCHLTQNPQIFKNLTYQKALYSSISISSIFVFSLYFFDKIKYWKLKRDLKNDQENMEKKMKLQRFVYDKDDSEKIKSRTKAAFFAALLSLSISAGLLGFGVSFEGRTETESEATNLKNLLKTFGLETILKTHLSGIYQSLALIGTLFAGPILQLFLQPNYHNSNFISIIDNDPPEVIAKLLFTAPVTEEIVYRSCLVPLLSNYYTKPQLTWRLPLFFGLAHTHHLYERIFILKYGVIKSLAMTILQFTYTYLFGAISTKFYCHSNSLPAVILMHSFCNLLGFPDFVAVFREKSLVKKLALSVTYLAGLAGFVYGWNYLM